MSSQNEVYIWRLSTLFGNNFFNRRKTLRKALLSYYLFSAGILRIIKTFHSRPISCLTELLNCRWKLCIINFRWGSSSVLFQFSRLNLPWCTLVNYIVGFLAYLDWKQWMRYLGGADVDGSCIRGRKLHGRPWTMITSNHISKLLKMQLESKNRNVHTYSRGPVAGFISKHAVTTQKSISIRGSLIGKPRICARLQLV